MNKYLTIIASVVFAMSMASCINDAEPIADAVMTDELQEVTISPSLATTVATRAGVADSLSIRYVITDHQLNVKAYGLVENGAIRLALPVGEYEVMLYGQNGVQAEASRSLTSYQDMYGGDIFSSRETISVVKGSNQHSITLYRRSAWITLQSKDKCTIKFDRVTLTLHGAGRNFNLTTNSTTDTKQMTYSFSSDKVLTDDKTLDINIHSAVGVFDTRNLETLTFYKDDTEVASCQFYVPVWTNSHTTLSGNLFSGETNGVIMVDETWGDPIICEI